MDVKLFGRVKRKLSSILIGGGDKALSKFDRNYISKDIPKIIWIFWTQGEEKATFW